MTELVGRTRGARQSFYEGEVVAPERPWGGPITYEDIATEAWARGDQVGLPLAT